MPVIQPLSFFLGFAFGIAFTFLLGWLRPLWGQFRQNLREQREAAQVRRTSGLEDNHRRLTLRRAQGMHLAAPLFALDEVLVEPRLLAPPPRVEPGSVTVPDDVITMTLPYMPMWPEIAAIYRAPSLTLTDALSGSTNLVITGRAGLGKTVALAHLASLAANLKVQLEAGKDAIPFLYHVADLQLPFDGTKDPLNIIINAASERAPIFDLNRMPQFVQQAFKSGTALLLLDGFDELEPQSQTQVTEWLKALLQAYPAARIVTTGCANQLSGLVSLGFQPLALLPWDTRKTNEFIIAWGHLWSQTVALEAASQAGPGQVDPFLLNSWISADNTLLTPFELTLKLWAAYAGDGLGPRVLDAIAAHIRRLAPSGTPVAALELLAMQVVLTSQPIFDSSKARSWVRKYEIVEDQPIEGEEDSSFKTITAEKIALTDSQRIKLKKSKTGDVPSTGLLGKIIESGLLITHANGKLRFLHPVLNGYLAGGAIGDNEADITLAAQPEWDGKTLAMYYLAARSDASAIADYLLKESTLPLHASTFTVSRWLRDTPKQSAWRSKVFASLFNLLQAEGQPLSLRAQAMAAFVVSNDPGAAQLFRQSLASRSFEVMALAALGAGAIRDTKAVETLEEIIQSPVIGSVRRAACLALVAIGTDKALEAVARALLQGDEELRRAAAEALANDPVEGHAILKEGATLADIMLRRAVVHGLAHVGEPWAMGLLQTMQVEDDQWAVRNLANQYLEQLAHPGSRIPRKLTPPSESAWLIEFAGKQGKGIPKGSAATDVLLNAFKSGTTEQRLAALPYLKRMSDEGVIGAFYNALYGDDPEVREASFYAVAELAANGVNLPHPNKFGLG